VESVLQRRFIFRYSATHDQISATARNALPFARRVRPLNRSTDFAFSLNQFINAMVTIEILHMSEIQF